MIEERAAVQVIIEIPGENPVVTYLVDGKSMLEGPHGLRVRVATPGYHLSQDDISVKSFCQHHGAGHSLGSPACESQIRKDTDEFNAGLADTDEIKFGLATNKEVEELQKRCNAAIYHNSELRAEIETYCKVIAEMRGQVQEGQKKASSHCVICLDRCLHMKDERLGTP